MPTLPEIPWWYDRCTHNMRELQNWDVLQEAEGVAIIQGTSEPFTVHAIVELAGTGSNCRAISSAEWRSMDSKQVMDLVIDLRRSLQSLNSMP